MLDWDSWWRGKTVNGKLFQFIKKITTAQKVQLISRMLGKLKLDRPAILELGAGSGMATTALVNRFSGSATLIDASHQAKLYYEMFSSKKETVEYKVCDILEFETSKKYDVSFSDGVISLFYGEMLSQFMQKHIQFLKNDGYVIIIVARNSWYIRFRDWSLGNEFIYKYFLKWVGVSQRSYIFEKLYSEVDLIKLCNSWHLNVLEMVTTYKTICVLARVS